MTKASRRRLLTAFPPGFVIPTEPYMDTVYQRQAGRGCWVALMSTNRRGDSERFVDECVELAAEHGSTSGRDIYRIDGGHK